MANIITGIRIFCSMALIFCKSLSPMFYVLYVIGGISDIADGIVARKTNTTSQFGSQFDTIADAVFVLVCMIKLLPIFNINIWAYVAVAVVVLIKVRSIIFGYSVHKTFVCVHSAVNKVTGLLLFLLPLTVKFVDLKYSVDLVCLVAIFAAICEGYYITKKG